MSIGYVAFRACESINLSSSLTSMQQSTATMKVGVSDMVWGARRGAYMTKYRYNTMYMLVMMESLLNNHYDMIKCENRRRRVSEKLFVCKYLLIITWWIFPSTQKNTHPWTVLAESPIYISKSWCSKWQKCSDKCDKLKFVERSWKMTSFYCHFRHLCSCREHRASNKRSH